MLKVRKTLREALPGVQALILATDPGTEEDLKDFCTASGFRILSSDTQGGVLRAVIQKC
jgi:tRNA 2-thiouridine synthesizing protein A